nr:hypothetical protein CFP56_28683 [Quercus suber]
MKTAFGIILCTAVAMAAAPLKAVIVSYPNDTPSSVVQQAKDDITAAVADAPVSALDLVRAQGTADNVVIEEDQVVNINS